MVSDADTYRHAGQIAFIAHKGQVDKAGEPYIGHPQRVAASVEGYAAKSVALLHDVMEDCSPYYTAYIEIAFPEEVVDAVKLLTHKEGVSNADYWAAIAKSPLARTVKIADIRDNINPERMVLLDEETRDRLSIKYVKALEALGEEV